VPDDINSRSRHDLQQAETRFRLVFEAAPNAMIMVDDHGCITLLNSQTELLFGHSRDELLGQPVEMLVPVRYRAAHPGHRRDFSQHPTTRTMGAGRDLYGLHKDGREVPIEIGLTPIRTDEGAFVLASIINITERKLIDQARQSSELRYRRLFESAKDGILILDADNGQIVDVNPYLIEMLGFSKEELTGKELWEIGVFKDIVASKRAFDELQQRGYIRYDDLPLKSSDGLVRQVEFVSNSYLVGESRVIQCNIRDITERKASEAALRASEARYRTLFECAPDGILIADDLSYYIDANASMCQMLGYSRDELIGMHASDIVIQTEFDHIEPALDAIKGRSNYHREWQFRRKDGSDFSAEVIATLMSDGNLMGMVRDVTERQNAVEELRSKTEDLATATQQLWQASKLATMGELAASVAHELNNPLATMALRSEMLVETSPDEPTRASAQIILNEVERMGSLVENLLQFSRRSYRQTSTVDVAEEISKSVNFVSYYLRTRKVEIVTDFAAAPTVQADRQQLRQVFLNLLTNAADSMPDGGTLITRTVPGQLGDAKAVMIEFVDSGIGIVEANLERIWDPFFTTKPEGKGTGLGLAICRRIVEEHGGTISIESLGGKGTTVRITLPATLDGVHQVQLEEVMVG
jgi:PAS domain S-box-containing protein